MGSSALLRDPGNTGSGALRLLVSKALIFYKTEKHFLTFHDKKPKQRKNLKTYAGSLGCFFNPHSPKILPEGTAIVALLIAKPFLRIKK